VALLWREGGWSEREEGMDGWREGGRERERETSREKREREREREREQIARKGITSNSECGYVPYEDVESQFGKVEIEVMIRRNILHYHPDSTFSRDLQPNPDFKVVSAIGVPALRAMEQLLERRRRRAAKQLHGPS
jgi:hypothetical protein